MKRALAERAAKQSLPAAVPSPNNIRSTTNLSSSSSSGVQSPSDLTPGPPFKIPRLEQPQQQPHHRHQPTNHKPQLTSSAAGGRPSSNGPSFSSSLPVTASSERSGPPTSNGGTVGRPSAAAKRTKQLQDDASAGVNEQSSFYLKHQNAALATELASLRFSEQQLLQERDARRQHCLAATQALHALQATWTQLETALCTSHPQEAELLLSSSSSNLNSNNNHGAEAVPARTGSGSAVEWTCALQEGLAALGRVPPDQQISELPENVAMEVRDLSSISSNVAGRAAVLQEWIWKVLRGEAMEQRLTAAEQQGALAEAAGKIRLLESQVAELAAVRDETYSRERRVRRNVHRLAAGMLNVDQVVKALESDDADQEIAAQIKLEQRSVQPQSETPNVHVKTEEIDAEKERISLVAEEQLRTRIQDLESGSASREKFVEELHGRLREQEERINQLSLRQQSDVDSQRLQSFEATRLKLESAEKTVSELESKLAETKEKWSQALGNEKAALASIDEQLIKFNKRWSELTGAITSESTKSGDSGNEPIDQMELAKRATTLEHKLSQALENVRQAETARGSLKHALAMNETLQGRIDDLRGKYAALQTASRNNAQGTTRPTSSEMTTQSTDPSNTTPRDKEAGSSTPRDKDGSVANSQEKTSTDGRSEKQLHRDFRRARKELAAMTASRDTAKQKLERIEKERDSLLETNARLLKQITEKDEMNAKSLSTILHLKSMTEQLSLEKDTLEQQAKSASQLALAARLATNAKERVSEEVNKVKRALEERIAEMDREMSTMKKELERTAEQWSEASGRMATLNSQLSNSLKRSNELIEENHTKREEVRTLVESSQKAEREARAAKEKLQNAVKNSGGGGAIASSFTADQLNTQISVLKGRLACPVCHYRDKECIIMRCRHMHCKQCVDERISNRSRKCPTCNVKFSEKDVEDVWLN